ncbi:MAG TPA: energy transducer TonB, partial [Chitinophagaceae bacterium]|nr:energy transducer TonB [Chitinophagaceae bacterium]
VNGVVLSRDAKDLNAISPNSIQSISVLKGEEAMKKYGDKGKEGVIEIITKQKGNIASDTDKVFTKVEFEPSFPGGDMAWARYVKKIIETHIDELTKDNKSGTYRVRFIVAQDGTVSNVEALTMKGTKLEEIVVDAIRKGPRWNPAIQNGMPVNAYREQPVTFTIQDDNKVYIKVEKEAEFPGGNTAWLSYLKKIVGTHINELANDNKPGTCRVRFIVSIDGTVSNVEALTMKGTKLAEVAVGGIRKGPKWVPATKNGQVVAAYKEVPVTFAIEPN